MGAKQTVCLALLAALFVGCRGQAFSFNASATYVGSRIIVGITVTAGDPSSITFECRLDNGPFQTCSDGFEFTSVLPGSHFVTVRGTSGGQSLDATLGPLTSVPELEVTLTVSVSGTVVTATIEANQAATFECQLDNEAFVPCISGFQYTGVAGGQHTIRVRATSTASGLTATTVTPSFQVRDSDAITFSGISATQDISEETVTFTFTASENFPVQCSIDGGTFSPCTSPYTVDVSSLSSGVHTITFNAIVNGEVRGSATQSFLVSEGVLVEFSQSAYSVIEDERVFNITVVRQGEPGQDIVVSILPDTDPNAGTARFPSDYGRDIAGTVTFTPGGPTQVTTQLRVLNDDRLEFDETVPLRLQLTAAAITAGGQLGLRSEAELTIINDDTEQVIFLQDTVTTDEGMGQAAFSVSFTPQRTDIPFTVIVETFDATPVDAIAGVDYQPLRRNVTLSPSVASQTLVVPIIQDQLTERTESFQARIIVPPETQRLGVELGSPSVLTVNIRDDDFAGDLEITCFTNVTGDNVNGRTVQLFFEANQDATFRCRINNEAFTSCTSPQTFRNVDISESVTVTVEGTTTLRVPRQTVTRTKNVFIAEGGLQVVGVGAIAVDLRASKNATYRCRLNNGQYVDCIDGQVFDGLAAGEYTLFIEATAVDNQNEVAYDVVGPIVIIAGAGADRSQAIAACFGNQTYRCDSNGQNCDYAANWRTRGDRVEFTLVAQTQGWVGIGFSINNVMVNSDIIVGAASSTDFFVDDRFATAQVQPPRDAIQNVDNRAASFINGITTVMFSRDKVTNDANQDIQLNRCLFFLYAWSGNANINTGVIQYHGSQNREVSRTLICLPSADFCPERFDCGDPGTPTNGGRVLMPDTREGSTVTYTCNEGYRLEGPMTRECVLPTDGVPEWTETIPECILNRCMDPGSPVNGDTMGTSTTVGSTVTHSCDSGYVLVGASERVCLPNATWSEPLPSCIVCTVEIVNTSITVGEGNSANVCVEKSGQAVEAFSVIINPSVFSPPEATPNVDYDQESKEIIFNPGDVIRCVEIDALPDTVLENTERFIAQLILPADTVDLGVTPGDRTETTISIIDNDEVLVCLKNDSYSVTEGGDVTVGIQINQEAETSFNVILSTSPGTATVSDYVSRTETVTFDPGETMAFVTFSTRDDEIVEGNEIFSVTLDIPAAAASLGVQKKSPDVATITIMDDNDEITVRFEEPEYSGDEPDEMVEVCLIKEGDNSVDVQVILTPEELTPASAEGGVDFSTANVQVTFAPDQTRRCVDIPFINDNIPEDDEMFNVVIQNSDDISPSQPSTTKITIIDEDRGIEFVNGTDVKVNEEQGSARFCIRRTGPTTNAMTVSLDYTSIIATVRADYSAGPSEIMFPVGVRIVCFDVPILEDDITEENEIFEIVATPNVGGPPTTISVCIRDNDEVTFVFTEPEYSGNETDRITEVCIEKIGRNEVPVTVTYMSVTSTTSDNPAEETNDFPEFVTSITYERGSNGENNTRCIEVPIVDDEDIEPTEEFTGKLTTNDSATIPDPEVPILIIDDDGVRVRFKKIKYFITEGDSPLELCLEKLGTVNDAVTVAVTSSDGTAIASSDYTAVSNRQITFQPDETMQCFEMTIANDNSQEQTEIFNVDVSPVTGDVSTVEPDTTCVTIIDDDVTRECRMVNMGRVFPFSQTGSQTSYVLNDVCEHTILTTCRDSDDFTINLDYSEGTLNIDRVGIRYNDATVVMIKNPMNIELKGLGLPISQSGQTIEYPNEIFITQSSAEIVVDLRRLGVKVTCTSSQLQIETSSGTHSGDLCGLCGRLNGDLVYSDRNTVADITDQQEITQFTNSWRALPVDMFLRDEAREECGINANDTIIGDPLFTTPAHISEELIAQNPNLTGASLCYEVHGKANSYFNLVSDKCTSVNAFYVSLTNALAGNIIGGIGINAVDQDGVCHRIETRLDQCSALVDGDALSVGETYDKAGIIVMRRRNRIRIALPNCGNVDLIMWFICQNVSGEMMSRFVISRGVNLQPTSHGMVGQFWNVPIEVSSFPLDPPALPHYVISVNASNGETRSFVGSLYERTWDATLSPCLYVGNRQGGPSGEFKEPNDSVLQGSYEDYEVSSLFSTDFVYSEFDSDTCGF